MNCIDAEKLLPLYARVDLDESSQSTVAAHLESCAHCRQLADEYKNIQGWIRLHEPPEFSEEFFAGIRQNVLREISQGPAASSPFKAWLGKLLIPTLPKTTFAVATAALLIISFAIGLLAFREYRSRTAFTAKNEARKSEPVGNANPPAVPTEDKSQALQEAKNGSRSRVAFNGASGNRVRRRIPRTTTAPTTLPAQDTLASANESTSTDSGSARSSDDQALRVEMQTQDPNVRIIWFAPNTKKSSVN